MSRILPPPSSLTDIAVRPVTDAHTALATIIKLPKPILRLPPGTLIAAVVVGDDGKGRTLLQTQYGKLTVATRASLASGSQVGFQVDAGLGQARSLTLILPQAPAPPPDGVPPRTGAGHPAPPAPPVPAQAPPPAAGGHAARAAAAPAPAAGGPAPAAGGPVPATPPAAVLRDAATFAATVTGPPAARPSVSLTAEARAALAPALAARSDGAPALAAGAQLTLRVLAIEAPATPTQAQAAPATAPPAPAAVPASAPPGHALPVPRQPPQAAAPSPGAPPALPPTPHAAPPAAMTPPLPPPAAPPAALPPAVSQVTAPTPAPAPGAPPETPPPAASPGAALLSGVITGSTQHGQPVLQTPLGELTFAARANLAPGSAALVEVVGAVREPPVVPQPAAPGGGVGLSRDWPALKEALALLHQVDPGLATQLAQGAIPRPGPGLTNELLFVLAAMRLGDMRGWLGEEAGRAIASRRPELAARLADDFTALAKLAAQPSAGEWRAFFIPIHDGQALQQVRVFTRRQRRKDASAEDDPATRFIVEAELTRLGPVQLDGLAHSKRFDLIVRTQSPLPEDMRRDIVRIFAEIRANAEWDGELAFQASPAFPVAPLEEIDERHVGVVV